MSRQSIEREFDEMLARLQEMIKEDQEILAASRAITKSLTAADLERIANLK